MSWQSFVESNVSYYSIDVVTLGLPNQDFDGVGRDVIQTISNGPFSYSVTDPFRTGYHVFYRLRAVYFDNSEQILAVASIDRSSVAFTSQRTATAGGLSARTWNLRVTNTGLATSPAGGGFGWRVDGIRIGVQSGPVTCAPTVSSAFPVLLPSLASNTNFTFPVTFNFTGCTAANRFQYDLVLTPFTGSAAGASIATPLQRNLFY